MFWDFNSLYGWAMSQNLPVDGFELRKDRFTINEEFMLEYDVDSDIGYILEVDVKYPKEVHELHNDFPFLPEKMKIGKCDKLMCNMFGKKNYVIHMNVLKQVLDYGLTLKKVHMIIEFNQEAWLNLYIGVNKKLRAKAKNDFQKDFFKQMNNSVSGKSTENVRKCRDIKLMTTDRRRIHIVSQPSYNTIKCFLEKLQQ